jgi:DNA-binding NarL/FixJ family response regulator
VSLLPLPLRRNEALRAGASGFLLKDVPEEQLVAAIHVVAAGGSLFAPTVVLAYETGLVKPGT